MPLMFQTLFFLVFINHVSAQEPSRKFDHRLSKPLIVHGGKIYACCDKDLFEFQSNGSISWTIQLNYTCDADMPPLYGGKEKVLTIFFMVDHRSCYDSPYFWFHLYALKIQNFLVFIFDFLQIHWKIYVVAENRILKINLLNIGTTEPAAEVLLRFGPDEEGNGEIVGLSVSTLVSSLFINIRSRGLFAYSMLGKLLWSAGPVVDRFGYRQGCRKNVTDCYFVSAPVIDQCEASIYVRFPIFLFLC